MTGLYLFATAAGLPLVLWFTFAGGDHGDSSGDTLFGDFGSGDADFSGIDSPGDTSSGGGYDGSDTAGDATPGGIGAVMLRLFPLNSIALALAAFGVTGLALTQVDTAASTTLIAAIVLGVVGWLTNTLVFSYIRRSSNTTSFRDDQLIGLVGRVTVPLSPTNRGKVAVSMGDQQINISALGIEGPEKAEPLAVGTPVVVVQIANGIAAVAPIDAQFR